MSMFPSLLVRDANFVAGQKGIQLFTKPLLALGWPISGSKIFFYKKTITFLKLPVCKIRQLGKNLQMPSASRIKLKETKDLN